MILFLEDYLILFYVESIIFPKEQDHGKLYSHPWKSARYSNQ